jgi:aminopeptidase N
MISLFAREERSINQPSFPRRARTMARRGIARPTRWLPGLLMLAACSSWIAASQAFEITTERGFNVTHYTARIDPDLTGAKLRGSEKIRVDIQSAQLRELTFDAGDLVINEVLGQGKKLPFQKAGKQLKIELPAPLAVGSNLDLDIRYHGSPKSGMEFHPEAGELYTIFSTSEWLVCLDAPDERATLDLSVALPATLNVTGNGRLVSKTRLGGDQELYRWRQDVPVPSFVYGFAAGPFHEATAQVDGVDLRFLSKELDPDQLQKLFADTGDMLKFFGSRAGIPYQGRYDQALVTKTIGQELAGFALLSEEYGHKTLEAPSGEALIAHEAAHQWWGIMLTCHSWSDFWLNEGFANFMAAAYIQHRFGEPAYQKIIDRWHRRVELLATSGTDHALVYREWNSPSDDDRAVVYIKGAYFLHLLRLEMGETEFWNGIREYTMTYRGRSVTTANFEQTMQRASKKNLDVFFKKWIDGSLSKSYVPASVGT